MEKKKVLVVDDEDVVCLSYGRILPAEEYSVQAAANGREALALLEREPFDVILLDLRMPEMDGLTVLQHIKEKWPDCAVVVITGYPSIQTAKEALRLGAFDYLAKPVVPEAVVKTAAAAVVAKTWRLREEKGSKESEAYGYRYPWEN